MKAWFRIVFAVIIVPFACVIVVPNAAVSVTVKAWRDCASTVPATTDCGTAILRFASGMMLQLQASWSVPAGPGWMIDVFGSKGRLVARSPTFPTARDCTLHGGKVGGALEQIAIPEHFSVIPGIGLDWQAAIQPSFPMALSMNAMVAAIGGKVRAVPDFAAALEIERIQEAIRISNAERRWVRLEEIQ